MQQIQARSQSDVHEVGEMVTCNGGVLKTFTVDCFALHRIALQRFALFCFASLCKSRAKVKRSKAQQSAAKVTIIENAQNM